MPSRTLTSGGNRTAFNTTATTPTTRTEFADSGATRVGATGERTENPLGVSNPLSALGLQSTPGATASFGGQNWVGGANGWELAPAGGNTAPQGPTQTTPNQFSGTFQNPWQTGVTAGLVNQAGQPAGTMNVGPNSNYVTQEAAQQVANLLGANVVRQNQAGAGPAGPFSQPMFGLDFGFGDVQDPGAFITAMQRGDRPEDIMARLQAGLSPTLGPGNRVNTPMFWQGASAGTTNPTGTLNSTGPMNVNPSTHIGAVAPPPQQPNTTQSVGATPLNFTNTGTQSGGLDINALLSLLLSGNLSGLAGALNQSTPQRRPALPGISPSSYSNSWYYPRFM